MGLSDEIYLQKSRLFLMPLIEVRRDIHIKPLNSFIMDDRFTEKDFKLILPFERDDSSEFYYYNKELTDSPCFDTDNYYETKKYQVYVYDLSRYKEDYNKFLKGQYSQFSKSVKSLIKIFWGKVIKGKFVPHPKIESYINPYNRIHEGLNSFEVLCSELDVKQDLLESVGEILNPPDLKKETFSAEDRLSKVRQPSGDSLESPSV